MFMNNVARVMIYREMHLHLVRMKYIMGRVAKIVETLSTGGNWSEAGRRGCFPLQRVTNQNYMNSYDWCFNELQHNDNNTSKAMSDSELRSEECFDEGVVV